MNNKEKKVIDKDVFKITLKRILELEKANNNQKEYSTREMKEKIRRIIEEEVK